MASLHKIGFRVAVQITCCQMMPTYLSFFRIYQNTRIDIRLKLLTTMKRPLILLLLVLLQLKSYDLVDTKEEVGNQGKEEEEKSDKDGEKKKDEEKEMGENMKEEKEMKEDMEDTCLSSPCGAHARCKNVQVPSLSSSCSPHGTIIIMVVKMVINFMVMITLS